MAHATTRPLRETPVARGLLSPWGMRIMLRFGICAFVVSILGCDDSTNNATGDAAGDVQGADVQGTDVVSTDVVTTDVQRADVTTTDVVTTDVPATDAARADAVTTDATATDGGGVSCNGMTCAAGEICVRSQLNGGAVFFADDAGMCPEGRMNVGGMCVTSPTFRCAARPTACAGAVTCACASTLCASSYMCQTADNTLVSCVLNAP